MNIQRARYIIAAILMLGAQAGAAVITNGGFESGLASWTKADQIGSEGTFSLQSGTTSPVNGFTVPVPPEGTDAAMTDAQGPGSHVLYQDFLIPTGVTSANITFRLYIRNGAQDFFTPATPSLDFSTPVLNQQVRVDILSTAGDPFSVLAADVIQNLYQSQPGNALISGYNLVTADLSTLFQARAGQTVRLRFAEADNVFTMNLGVDDVSINTGVSAVPEPSLWFPVAAAFLAGAITRLSRSRTQTVGQVTIAQYLSQFSIGTNGLR